MKLIYSHLQQLLPDLDIPPQQLRDDLTMIGHFCNFYEKVENEIIFDLDIKVNRGDCLGYYGLARDLSVFYRLPLKIKNYKLKIENSGFNLPIQVQTDSVTRVMAVKLSQIKNCPSPDWLSRFIRLHGSNSVNLIVDLTNYIMFLYGIPCHAFDTAISGDHLIWQMNPDFPEFTSLDGTSLSLTPAILMINNSSQPLSLSFWGGEACAIKQETSSAIIEMAVYNPSVVRQNSRSLHTTTEAAVRLEKSLDPELIPQAFNHLIQLITNHSHAQIASAIFDYYPSPVVLPKIVLDPKLPSNLSGINIPPDFTHDCLTRLGCHIDNQIITPPSIRPDLSLPEDLAEEIIRFYGYQKIPTNQPLSYKKLADITPKILYLIDQLKDRLVDLGYDEVITWPLVRQPIDPKTAVTTQNCINTEYSYLRQNITDSLARQLDYYQRFKLPHPQFFEIGRIYFHKNGRYLEQTALGLYHHNPHQLEKDVSVLFSDALPPVSKGGAGKAGGEICFAEIILDNLPPPNTYQPKILKNSAVELTSQIITLDANVTSDKNPPDLLRQYTALIPADILWSIAVVDRYQDRYTLRVHYYNCTDKTAKKTHLSVFNLST